MLGTALSIRLAQPGANGALKSCILLYQCERRTWRSVLRPRKFHRIHRP